MKFVSLILVSILIISATVESSCTEETQPMLYYVYRDAKIKKEKPPLLILLHGLGSNEEDLFALAEHLPDKYLIVSARAPHTLGKDSYAWFHADFSTGKPVINKEEAENSRLAILSFIEELKTKHQFDETQVYLLGFSQGGIMSYSVALTVPEKIKGIAVMSGRLLEETKTKLAPKEKLQSLAIFISHGTQDQILAIPYARAAKDFLVQEGLTPQYKEYIAGHTITNEMLTDVVNWLK